MLADSDYFSEAIVAACEAADVEPLNTMERQPHCRLLNERFAAVPPAPKMPTPVEAMAYSMKTPNGKQQYALRKQMPEAVFGIIKSVMGFRKFLLRGIDGVHGEWSLVTMAWNMKRMYALTPAECAVARAAELARQHTQQKIADIMSDRDLARDLTRN